MIQKAELHSNAKQEIYKFFNVLVHIWLLFQSEAFPEPVIYWERGDGLVIESKPHKYVIETHSTEKLYLI